MHNNHTVLLLSSNDIADNLGDIYKLLSPVASHWRNIGVMLGINDDLHDTIKNDEMNNSKNCLRAMLSTWIKKINPPPTWCKLVEAVEHYDPSLAEEIRCTYLPNSR